MRIGSGTPVVFSDGDDLVKLRRISHDDRAFNESFIQDLVLRHPDVLPAAELDETKSPLVPIGSEIATDVGPIDALFVSPSGGITIVEAKLWRNPESRREVVGQIIDYAQNLSTWSYERLDKTCRQATGRSLWELVCAADESRSPDSEAAKPMVFATTLVLITLVVLLNVVAISLRNRLRKKYAAAKF